MYIIHVHIFFVMKDDSRFYIICVFCHKHILSPESRDIIHTYIMSPDSIHIFFFKEEGSRFYIICIFCHIHILSPDSKNKIHIHIFLSRKKMIIFLWDDSYKFYNSADRTLHVIVQILISLTIAKNKYYSLLIILFITYYLFYLTIK